jgi:hypothetical protein
MTRVANCKASGEGRPIGSSRGRSIGDMAFPNTNQTKPFLALTRYDLDRLFRIHDIARATLGQVGGKAVALLEAVVPVRVPVDDHWPPIDRAPDNGWARNPSNSATLWSVPRYFQSDVKYLGARELMHKA